MAKKNEKKESAVAEAKPKVKSVVSVIKEVGVTGAKDRKELAEKVLAKCKEYGIEKNAKGFPIREERIKSLLSAFIRDIVSKRKGHWSTYEIKEDDKSFAIVPKPSM